MKNKNFYKKILLAYLFLVIAIFTAGFFLLPTLTSSPFATRDLIYTPEFLSIFPTLIFIFLVFHAADRFKKYGLLLVALTLLIPTFFEWFGMYVEVLFGFPYAYSGLLGIQLYGFPVGVMLAWFVLIYCSFTITNLIFDRQTVWLAVFDAAITTSIDLVVDPVMTSMGAWKWFGVGEYFGIPLGNYLAWFAISLIICLIFRFVLLRKKFVVEPSRTNLEKLWTVLPVVVYMFYFVELWMLASFVGKWDAVLIGLLSSQIIALLALFRFYEKYW